jgi:hypothetical protein
MCWEPPPPLKTSSNIERSSRPRRAFPIVLASEKKGVYDLFLVDAGGGDFVWSLGIVGVSISSYNLLGSSMHQMYL